MRICVHCGESNREGVLFCANCGIALVPVPLATRQLTEENTLIGTDELDFDGVIVLQVDGSDTPIMVQMRFEIVLGRVSGQEDGTAYIDLSPFNAVELGVSRRHARLIREGRSIYLLDMKSTNGTRLNGEQLPHGVERRLRDGDELILGRLRLSVFFNS